MSDGLCKQNGLKEGKWKREEGRWMKEEEKWKTEGRKEKDDMEAEGRG